MKKTKIICTMGPNTNDRELIKQLALNGMDIARFNFSHGDHDEQSGRFALVESVRQELNIPIDRVVRHYDASRKNCPQSMSGNGWAQWYKFKEKLKGEDLTMAQYEELKNEISQLTETVKVLATELHDLKHPMIYNYIDKNMPEWARSAVLWAVENGILNGDENGLNLDDKDLRFITMMYRMRKQ